MKIVKKIRTSDKNGNRQGCVVLDLSHIISMIATPSSETEYQYDYEGQKKKLLGEKEVELDSVEVELHSNKEINPSGYQPKCLSFHCTAKQADALADEIVEVMMSREESIAPKKDPVKTAKKQVPKKK